MQPPVARSGSAALVPALPSRSSDRSGPVRWAGLFSNLVQIYARSLDTEKRGDHSPEHGGNDQAVEQKTRADGSQQDGEKERRCHRSDLGEGRGKARPGAADRGWENLAGQQISLRIGAKVGHEVEEHKADEDQGDLQASSEINRKRGNQQAHRAADEAEDLQADPAELVGQHYGKDNADDQQQRDHRVSSGGA